MGLKEYKAKRDFTRTHEPTGAGRSRGRSRHAPSFVIQKHAARSLHYDFRLEMEGVFKSWAVPKGLPTKRGEKHLAVQVEDHSLEYGDFEGTIPEGEYGAGTVMVWDKGAYEMMGGDPIGGLESGKMHLALHGQKLKGEWTLVRMRHPRDGDKPQWLVMKTGDDAPRLSARNKDKSALTKRSLEKIASQNTAQWRSNRTSKATLTKPIRPRRTRRALLKADRTKLPAAKPRFVEPMKCVLSKKLPIG